MTKAKPKYRVMKYEGDDCYSYAVFHSKDVKGLRSPVFDSQLPTGKKPIVTGCGKSEADHYKKQLESGWHTGKSKITGPTLHVPAINKLPEISSLQDLRYRATNNPRYARLAIISTSNLGGPSDNWDTAMQTLETNALEAGRESREGDEGLMDAETMIVDEINGCLDIEADEHIGVSKHEEK